MQENSDTAQIAKLLVKFFVTFDIINVFSHWIWQ